MTFIFNCPAGPRSAESCEPTTKVIGLGPMAISIPASIVSTCYLYQVLIMYFRFSTRESNGLLFYNGRFNEQHDFIALEIVDKQVQFSFSLGSEVTQVKATVNGGVSDGAWHKVTVFYLNRVSQVPVNYEGFSQVARHSRLGSWQENPQMPSNAHRLRKITAVRNCHFNRGWAVAACGNL